MLITTFIIKEGWKQIITYPQVFAMPKNSTFVDLQGNEYDILPPLKTEKPQKPTPEKPTPLERCIGAFKNASVFLLMSDQQKRIAAECVLKLPIEEMPVWLSIINNWTKEDGVDSLLAELAALESMKPSARSARVKSLNENSIPF